MIRRPSRTESSSSSSEITFDDVDDHQVFALLEEGDEERQPASAKPSKGMDFRLDLSSRVNPAPASLSPAKTVRKSRTKRASEAPALRSGAVAVPSAEVLRMAALAEAAAAEWETEAIAARAKARSDAEALAALGSKVGQLEQEREHLQAEVHAARATIQDLEQKVIATEQSSDLFARQLANVKESYQTKLLLREEAMATEKAAVAKEKESEMQHQQALFMKETELWKQQIGSLTKGSLELRAQNETLNLSLQAQQEENESLQSTCHALQVEQRRDRDEIQFLSSWKEQYEHTLEDFDAKHAELEQATHDWMSQCEQLKQQANGLNQQLSELLLEREDQYSSIDMVRQKFRQEQLEDKAKLQRTLSDVQRLRGVLRQMASETRELLKSEMRTTESTLLAVQEQAYELVIRRNQQDMKVVAKQNKIIQLEAQRKSDKQTMSQLEAALASTTRTLERKEAAFKSKYQEQKEHLELTLAVRHGLTNELHTKKQQVLDLEKQVSDITQVNDKVKVKNQHLQQQIKIMQHTHTRELEQFARVVMEANNKKKKRSKGVASPNQLSSVGSIGEENVSGAEGSPSSLSMGSAVADFTLLVLLCAVVALE